VRLLTRIKSDKLEQKQLKTSVFATTNFRQASLAMSYKSRSMPFWHHSFGRSSSLSMACSTSPSIQQQQQQPPTFPSLTSALADIDFVLDLVDSETGFFDRGFYTGEHNINLAHHALEDVTNVVSRKLLEPDVMYLCMVSQHDTGLCETMLCQACTIQIITANIKVQNDSMTKLVADHRYVYETRKISSSNFLLRSRVFLEYMAGSLRHIKFTILRTKGILVIITIPQVYFCSYFLIIIFFTGTALERHV